MITTFSNLSKGQGAIAITVDDGPNPDTTKALLDVLDVFGAKANFFTRGSNAKKYPELGRMILQGGHGLFNHGYDHIRFSELDNNGIVRELEQTEEQLGFLRPSPSPYFIRPPFGEGCGLASVQDAVASWRPDAAFVLWNLCCSEWLFIDDCRTPARIHDLCAGAVGSLSEENWDGGIVLLHDWPAGPPEDHPYRPLAPAFCAALLEQYLIKVDALRLRPVVLGK